MKELYFDNAATTKPYPEVVAAMTEVLASEYGNPSSAHGKGQRARDLLEGARATVANSIGASPQEITFTSGGTESNELAILGLLKSYQAKAGVKGHIITSAIEHKSILDLCKQLAQEGHPVSFVPVDRSGFVSIEQLQGAFTKTTALVSIMHANNEVGTIQDIKAIGALCRQHQVPLHVDCVQSYLRHPLDVRQLPCDLATLSAHKIHGPQGVGALYVREGISWIPVATGGGQERNRRPGTQNMPGIVGFEKAIQMHDPLSVDRLRMLLNLLYDALKRELQELSINGCELNSQQRVDSILNLRIPGVEARLLLQELSSLGLYVSVGSACSSKDLVPSHVLMALGYGAVHCNESIRLSISATTTQEEVLETVRLIAQTVHKIKSPRRKRSFK